MSGRKEPNPIPANPATAVAIREAINLLGVPVQDRVTKMKGIVTSISFDLYGCIMAIVNPGLTKEGTKIDVEWFDVKRLKVTSDRRVLPLPSFAIVDGPESKPIPSNQ